MAKDFHGAGKFATINPGTPIKTITDDYTVDESDFGNIVAIATDAKTITLPSAANGGSVTILNSGADGNNIVTISPASTDAIVGTVANAAADSVSGGVANKNIVNTKATANKGDHIVLASDGGTTWYIVGGVGIWASAS